MKSQSAKIALPHPAVITFPKPCGNARGFAIWISLLVVLLLAVLIFELDFQTRVDLRGAEHFRDDVRALHLVRSAVAAGQAFLKTDRGPSDNLTEAWATPTVDYPLGDGTLSAQLYDESGKFNLNALVNNQRVVQPKRAEQLQYLLELLEVPQREANSLVGSIVDWLDTVNDGAENAVYQRRNPPYLPKNGPLDTLEEIRLVDGMTDALYRRVAPYLTIYGDTGADGPTGKININTADPLVIRSLNVRIDEPMVAQLRQNRPYRRPGAIQAILGNTKICDNIPSCITVRSDYFSMEVIGRVHDVRKVARAVVRRGVGSGLLYFRVE